jgi:hypothetical protein
VLNPEPSEWSSGPPPPRVPRERTDRELLGQIARDVGTIKTVVVFSFWLSVIAGILLAYANSSSTP